MYVVLKIFVGGPILFIYGALREEARHLWRRLHRQIARLMKRWRWFRSMVEAITIFAATVVAFFVGYPPPSIGNIPEYLGQEPEERPFEHLHIPRHYH